MLPGVDSNVLALSGFTVDCETGCRFRGSREDRAGTCMDWISSRVSFCDLIHDSGVPDGRPGSDGLPRRTRIIGILRLYGSVVIGGPMPAEVEVDRFRYRCMIPDSVHGLGQPDGRRSSSWSSEYRLTIGIPGIRSVAMVDGLGVNGSGCGLDRIPPCDSRFSPQVRGLEWLTDFSWSQSRRRIPGIRHGGSGPPSRLGPRHRAALQGGAQCRRPAASRSRVDRRPRTRPVCRCG